MEKHPFGRGWTIVRFGVVYGRQKRLEGDGFRRSEKGHGGGADGMVVVIEQVVLRARSESEADWRMGFEITSELNLTCSAVVHGTSI